METARYIVRCRSFTEPARVFDRGGWHRSVKWTRWRTVARLHTLPEAEAAVLAGNVGLTRCAVFLRGKRVLLAQIGETP